VLESGDVVAMAPGTRAGAAHPFIIPQMDPVIRKKLENDNPFPLGERDSFAANIGTLFP
jgi:membrane-bound ClpP family serine protease